VQSSPSERASLARLAKEYWEQRLAAEPLVATLLGDRRFDAVLPDVTPVARARRVEAYESIIAGCAAIREEALSGAERLTKVALMADAQTQLDKAACGLEDWTVDPLQGPQVELANVESYQSVASPTEGSAMVKRWVAIGSFFDDHITNLQRGATEQKLALRVCVEKVIDEIEGIVKSGSDSAFLRPIAVPHENWPQDELRKFREGLISAVQESVIPAYAKYLGFLRLHILPKSRPQERPGIIHVPGGREAYLRLIRVHTTLDLTPEELHQTGLNEVMRVNREMEVLGEKVFGVRDRKEILRRLRTDTSLYFSSRDEVAEKAERALSKARSAIAKWFGRLPRTRCEVVRMEEHEEKHSTIAYYRQPAADGSRPGRYHVNTSAPETRPRYEAEALAYHESIPGHHLQIAVAQELEDIPDFRRNGEVTAFVEGWGLYSERLADEMGLYSSDLDRIGMLSYDSWRACRLVVDTGMHAMRWSRQQAIEFMMENTALAENNVVNEVDRYVSWPGQALAYKTGQLEMMRLRHRAQARLGRRFDIRRFHDVLLGAGALPLKALGRLIEGCE
jgi:uncharacterized protein (DUF885 family)